VRKTFVFLFILILSQAASAVSFRYGIKGGVTFGKIYGAFDYSLVNLDKKSNIGFIGGVLVHGQISDNFVLAGEADFIQKGVKGEGEYLGIGIRTRLLTEYLQVNVSGKYLLSEIFGLYAGLGTGYLVKAELTAEVDGGSEETQDVMDYYRPIEISILGGAQLIISKNSLIDLRYEEGLTNLRSGDEEGAREKSKTLSLSIGYLF